MFQPLPTLLGILNITEDSFSDGGRYLDPAAAIAKAHALLRSGADILDLGAASSKPGAKPVPAEIEIARLAPMTAVLAEARVPVSIDSFSPKVQRWALKEARANGGVQWLNDVRGFPEPELYAELADSNVGLIVMHSVDSKGPAPRIHVSPEEILDLVSRFFEQRLAAFERAGIARKRVVLDPGMGFFLGTATEASLVVLRGVGVLKTRFDLPVLISVSRKSFLRKLAGVELDKVGPASLAAELFAIRNGADLIRTHEPGPLAEALKVERALEGLGPRDQSP